MTAPTEHIPRALTVAGSDSGGGAGIQADLKTFAAFGVYGTSAVTALTAQNTLAVSRWEPVSPALIRAQVEAVLDDIGADAVKTGMLGTAAAVREVAAVLRERATGPLVVDPVLVATTGDALADGATAEAIVRDLLPLATVITPNAREAATLTGTRVETWDDARRAAAQLIELGARAVVITGGEFGDRASAIDLLFDGRHYREYTSVRVASRSTHGTGCTFSAAIAAGLAKGMMVEDAVALAKSYVTLAIQHAVPVGSGVGPVHHFYRYYQPSGPRYRPGVPIEA